MILLSAHKDTVKHPFRFESKNGRHEGLLDNAIGVLASYLTVYGNQSLMKMFREGEIGFFHSDHEEFGLDDFPEVTEKDTVIVVDVACGDRYKDNDFVIDTWHGFEAKEISSIVQDMAWEKFNFKYFPLIKASDESDVWEGKKARVVSFIIPITAPNDNWHGEEAVIKSEDLERSVRALQRLICHIDCHRAE